METRKSTPLPALPDVGFQTIYEEDESQNTLQKKAKPQIPPKPRKILKPPVPIKRRPPPPIPGEQDGLDNKSEAFQRKRFSMASLDESVVSADSGVGSSNYDAYYGSEISSLYLSPGSRNTIYSGSMTEGSEGYYTIKPIAQRPAGVRVTDSGVDSSADTDELNGRFGITLTPSANNSFSKGSINSTTEDHESEGEYDGNNTYEQLPDFIETTTKIPQRKEKQPCVGHHEHLTNSPCKSKHKQIKSLKNSSGPITISTQTTPSLERPTYSDLEGFRNVRHEWKSLVNKAFIPDGDQDEMYLEPHFKRHDIIRPHSYHDAIYPSETDYYFNRRKQSLENPHLGKSMELPLSENLFELANLNAHDSYFGENSSKYLLHSNRPPVPRKSWNSHSMEAQESDFPTSPEFPTPKRESEFLSYSHRHHSQESNIPDYSRFTNPHYLNSMQHQTDDPHYLNNMQHQTDEEKLSDVLEKLKKDGKLGRIAGQVRH